MKSRATAGPFLLVLLALTGAGYAHRATAATSQRPNILVILADDMGFADAGCYGGEIVTPNIDRLAANGVRFTQFYNTGRCWPTRAALLSGYYPQQIRMDPPRGRLPEGTRLLPHYLKPLGYRSYHSGKWHVNGAPKTVADGGFDRSYRIEDHDRNFYPTNHWLDDARLPLVPKGSSYYTTVAFADFMVECLKDHAKKFPGQPFFGYLAFTAPHFPLQAPSEDIARYRDKYLEGWDVIRQRRYERQVKMGLVNCALSEREPDVVPHWNLTDAALKEQIGTGEVARAAAWSELTDEERRFQATKMAIHAAMIDRMDREIGRVIDQLKAMGALENTIVMFASDNGASAEFVNRGDKHGAAAALGSGGSFLCLGPGWSTVGNTPFRLHKSWVHEGGISTPLIVHWPGKIKAKGKLRHDVGHVIDIVPTVLDLVGARPGTKWNGAEAPPLPGRSLVPAFAKDGAVRRDFLYFHHDHNRALRVGDWKIVARRPDTNSWSLYNLRTDRSERLDLAGQHPERVQTMSVKWMSLEKEFRARAGANETSALRRAKANGAESRPPNIVIILADDLGYGDLGCYGHPNIRTPNLDRMAAEGMRFTEFYSTAEVCSPSRAALLTGRYPIRSGMCHDRFRVLRANATGGLPAEEITLAEALKARGYATACIGKWHLGNWANNPVHHPRRHGFDFYFGLPHSNDMNATTNAPRRATASVDQRAEWWNAPLYRNEELIERPADQTTLTRRYTEEAVRFIREHRDDPFLLYLPHSFPHVPLFASDRFRGKSARGLYGDVVEELDWSVGEVLAALRRENIAENTLVIFTSDNGPWLIMDEAGGSAGPLRDGKGSTWEGGMRVPGIVWRPGRIAPGQVQREFATHMDLFTTALKLAGADVPRDRAIDGVDIAPLLFGNGSIEREAFFYYRGPQLYAARVGPWKANFITRTGYGPEKPQTNSPPLLFHLSHDPGERFNVATNHPAELARINAAVERHRAGLQPVPSQFVGVVGEISKEN